MASKYEVPQQQQPEHRHKEEEEKQQQTLAVVLAQSPLAAAASSTASISTTITDDSDLSGSDDYSDDAFTVLSARGPATAATVAVESKPAVASHPSAKPVFPPFGPARTASSIESEARYSNDEYAEESVQEALASPKSMAEAPHVDPEQSVEEEDFTL